MADNSSQTLTGALGIVRVGSTILGKLKDVQINESISRERIGGIGSLLPDEKPAIQWSGRLTCSQAFVDLSKTQIPNALRRDVADRNEFEDQLVLDSSVGVQVDIYKKVSDFIDPNTGKKRVKTVPLCTVSRCMIEGDSFNLSLGQSSTRSYDFEYLDPCLIPIV